MVIAVAINSKQKKTTSGTTVTELPVIQANQKVTLGG